MYLIFSGADHRAEDTLDAFEKAQENNDLSQVPIIIEFTRFMSSPFMVREASLTLAELTGRRFNTDWNEWMEWLGDHSDKYQPPEGYLNWKANLLSVLDPRFEGFILPGGLTARINMTEVVWGGVRPDGIPDLQNSPVLDPDEAGYLDSRERVFGVSINGEHRAYPLRILNPHEMANDVLGGEPFALAY